MIRLLLKGEVCGGSNTPPHHKTVMNINETATAGYVKNLGVIKKKTIVVSCGQMQSLFCVTTQNVL